MEPKPLSEGERAAIVRLSQRTLAESRPIGQTLEALLAAEQYEREQKEFWLAAVRDAAETHTRGIHDIEHCNFCGNEKNSEMDNSGHAEDCPWARAQSSEGKEGDAK